MLTGKAGTRHLTVRYLLTLSLLGGLALANYLILSVQIETNRAIESVVMSSGRQRSDLQRSALLAQKLVISSDEAERRQLRRKLTSVIQPLEDTHHSLVQQKEETSAPPQQVLDVYFNSPWLLDTEMRNYIAQMRSLVKTPDSELNWGNPHIRYIDEAAQSGKMVEALDKVVAAYQVQSYTKMNHLKQMASWSLGSTVIVLGLTGLFVFRPMVRRVRQEMDSLENWNDTLEIRVAQRTAEAEQRARELAKSEAELRNQRRILQSILDNMGDGVIVVDEHFAFRLINPAAREILALREDDDLSDVWSPRWSEQCGIKLFSSDSVTPYPSDQLPLVRAVNGQSTDRAELCLKRDGQQRTTWLSVTARPLVDNESQVRGGVAVLRDVTPQKTAEQALVQSERLAAIGQMVTGVAHESRNALQQIQACCGLLEWKLEDNESVQGLIADLQKAKDRLHRLFDDLRGYAAPMKLDRRPSNLCAVVEEAWQALDYLCDDRDVNLLINSGFEEIHCEIDPFKLEQVLRNIFENALLACEDPVVIKLTYSHHELPSGPGVRISVRDNGPGMNDKQRERIFDAFYTTRTKGTGLGMAIAKRIIEAHDGQIEARNNSESGKGAEIRIVLPRILEGVSRKEVAMQVQV